MSRFILWLRLLLPVAIIALIPAIAFAQAVQPLPPDISLITQAFTSGVMPLIVWAAIWLGVYAFRFVAPSVWDKIPSKYKPIVIAGLGVVTAVAQAVLLKQPWLPTLIQNIFAALSAIGADQIQKKLRAAEG